MKFLERFVSDLLGEPIEFKESEKESGINSQFSFFGRQVYGKKPVPKVLDPDFIGFIKGFYPKATKESVVKPDSDKFRFYGEEAYTIQPVAKVSSVPAPAPDVSKAEEQPLSIDAVEELILENPGIMGAALIELIKSMGIKLVDRKRFGQEDPNAPSIEQQIQDIMLKTPDISGQSLFAAMKAEGIEVEGTTPEPAKSDEIKAESDSVTGTTAVLRGKKQSKKKKESQYMVKDSHFIEASRDDGVGPTKFKVALIQEGLGNLRDCYYYTREALEMAAATAAFEGRKCFADHPSMSEESDRPERSVRDIIGHFENVHVEEADDGSAKLVADLIMLPSQPYEWARSLVSSAIRYSKKYPDRELVGLSINASGDAKAVDIDKFMNQAKLPESAKPKLLKAKDMGATQVRVVSGIKDAMSVDLVTEPGCKGKIEAFIEGEKND